MKYYYCDREYRNIWDKAGFASTSDLFGLSEDNIYLAT